MLYEVKLYSKNEGEIEKFLNLYFDGNFNLENKNFWTQNFENPIELINIVTTFVDNKEKFDANILVSIDKNIYIIMSENNINSLVKYIYERFPD